MMELSSRPSMAELRFLPNIKKPAEIWQKCVKAQDDWEKRLSFVDCMGATVDVICNVGGGLMTIAREKFPPSY